MKLSGNSAAPCPPTQLDDRFLKLELLNTFRWLSVPVDNGLFRCRRALKMSTSSRGSRLIVLLMIASAITAACGSRNLVLCTTGDMASLDPDAAKSLELNDSSWLRAARICDMGEYLVVTPIERDKKPIFVIRKGNPSRALFAATDKTTGLFDAD